MKGSQFLAPTITGDFQIHPTVESPLSAQVARLGEDTALVHPEHLDPLTWPPGSGGNIPAAAGHPRHLSGPVELFLGLGRQNPYETSDPPLQDAEPEATGPNGSCSSIGNETSRAGDSHGDIVFWPVLALAQYLSASEDGSLLGEIVPFFHPEGDNPGRKGDAMATCGARPDRNRHPGHSGYPAGRPTATGTGTIRCSRLTRPCARACAQLDRDAPLPDFHYTCHSSQAAWSCDKANPFEAMAGEIRDQFQRRLLVDEAITGSPISMTSGTSITSCTQEIR